MLPMLEENGPEDARKYETQRAMLRLRNHQ
jgi:hypothetical protein